MGLVKRASLLALFALGSLNGFGQKIKYKDLFILLNAKQFDQAAPFLQKYLKENDDNPNAFLFMGLIYQDKFQAMDVLKETDGLLVKGDSSVFYLDLATK